MTSTKPVTDGVREALERLREIAYRDEAKSVTVRTDDLRAALTPAPEAERLDAATMENQHYLTSIKLRLGQLYDEHPNDSRLREQISDEVDWIDAAIAGSAS